MAGDTRIEKGKENKKGPEGPFRLSCVRYQPSLFPGRSPSSFFAASEPFFLPARYDSLGLQPKDAALWVGSVTAEATFLRTTFASIAIPMKGRNAAYSNPYTGASAMIPVAGSL